VPDLGSARFRLIWYSLRYETGRWLAVAALGGLTLAATLGALRPAGRTTSSVTAGCCRPCSCSPCWPSGRSSRWWAR
jgi:hypothetical protein